MTDDVDSKLSALLLSGAPPARDPLFRIRVIERRERERHRQRSRALLAGAAFVVLAHGVALALAPDVFTAGIGALIGLAVLGVGAASVAFAVRIVKALRGLPR